MIDSETPLPIQFTRRERDLIVNLLSVEPEIVERFQLAILKGKMLVVNLSAGDLDTLQGAIAADANHTEEKKLQRELDDLFERLDEVLASDFPEE
ncbi:MAG: hypothetical protein HYR67_07985 [Bacteroidetes bacterium]|nr:hypothetical protein [Bacteroidota bacterium]